MTTSVVCLGAGISHRWCWEEAGLGVNTKIWTKSASIAGQVSDILINGGNYDSSPVHTGTGIYLPLPVPELFFVLNVRTPGACLNFSRVFSPESSSRKTALKGGEQCNGYINRIIGYRTVPECELKIQSRYLVPSDRWGFHIYNPILWRFPY